MNPLKPSFAALAFLLFGCGSGPARSPAANSGGTGGAEAGQAGAPQAGAAGHAGTAGQAGAGAGAGAGGQGVLPPDPCVQAGTCQAGTWINVTPKDMDATVLRPSKDAYGPGSIVRDPARPSDLYVGGSKAGLWRSTDYGNTWSLLTKDLPDVPRGVTIAVAGTSPPTLWAASYNELFKSVDGGQSFRTIKLDASLYSLQVDPHDDTHLLSGLHEADGLLESSDGGETWHSVAGGSWPAGGVSWYPYFIDSGDPAATRKTWLAIAQNGATPSWTHDGGAHWSEITDLRGLQHPHGNSQLYQRGQSLFIAGVSGPGQGVYRSADLGQHWARVDSGNAPEALVWGTARNVYAMYAWACSNCDLGTSFERAAWPGDSWSAVSVTSALQIGPNSVVVTSDGTHEIAVAVMWDQGIWRYVEAP